MNNSDFTPEYSPEQILFISARRYFTYQLFQLLPLLRLKGFSDSASEYQIYGPDGSEMREDNQDQLDGQLVQVGLKFSHLGRKHHFDVILTNDEHWRLIITLRSSVALERILISGLRTEDLEAAYVEVNGVLLSTIGDVYKGRVTKTRTQPVYVGSVEGQSLPAS